MKVSVRNPLIDADEDGDSDDDDEDICDRISRLARENPGNIALNTFDAGYYSSLQSTDKRNFLRCLNSVRCLACGRPKTRLCATDSVRSVVAPIGDRKR